MQKYIEFFGLPGWVTFCLVLIFCVMQGIGELLTFKGKVVPEIMSVRKYFKRRREEKESMKQVPAMLKEVKELLASVDQHYSADNISKRDEWMNWVNRQADTYDESIAELKTTMVKLLVDNKRNFLLDFTTKAADLSRPMSKEQYQRFYNVHEEYEEILKENGMTNGQVDVAYEIANKSYEERMKSHTFIEDSLNYGSR